MGKLPALHRKISAKELVESSINTALLKYLDSEIRYNEFSTYRRHNDDNKSYDALLEKYEELATAHLKLKRKYENAMHDLHDKAITPVDETVQLKHTIIELKTRLKNATERLKNERQKAYEQLYQEGIKIKCNNSSKNEKKAYSSYINNNSKIKETKALLTELTKEKMSNVRFNDYVGHFNDSLLDCLHNLIDEYDNQNILSSNLKQENKRKDDVIERLQCKLSHLAKEKGILNQKLIFLKKELNNRVTVKIKKVQEGV